MSDRPESDGLRRVIGFWGGAAVIVGITIGSGIFRKPYTLARDVGDPVGILGLWVGFGLVSLCGALALAELSSMLPHTGGAYVYLRAAYGDAAAFTFGWLYLVVTTPATLGALATFVAELLLGLAGADSSPASPDVAPIAVATILVLAAVNVGGARLGSAVQTFMTVVKVAALVALAVTAFSLAGGSFGHLAPSGAGARNLGSGAASVIWAYDGWIAVSMIAGEVVAPEKRMRRIIIGGMLAIVLLYVGVSVAYFYAMPIDVMAREEGVPQRIMSQRFGPTGATLIAAAILCSVLGALNGNLLTKPRVPYALARDGLAFSFLGRAHARWATPHAAILIQAAVAVILIAVLRDFDRLTTYFVVVEWSALLFAVGAVLVLRYRQPEAPRPFRTPGYPWVPLVFIAGTLAGLGAIVRGQIDQPRPDYAALWGLLIAGAGLPLYHLWKRRAGGSAGSEGRAG